MLKLDAWGRLERQAKLQFVQQDGRFRFWLGVARHRQPATVSGGQPHVEHLDGSQLLQHRS